MQPPPYRHDPLHQYEIGHSCTCLLRTTGMVGSQNLGHQALSLESSDDSIHPRPVSDPHIHKKHVLPWLPRYWSGFDARQVSSRLRQQLQRPCERSRLVWNRKCHTHLVDGTGAHQMFHHLRRGPITQTCQHKKAREVLRIVLQILQQNLSTVHLRGIRRGNTCSITLPCRQQMFYASGRVIKWHRLNCRMAQEEPSALRQCNGMREHAPHLMQPHTRRGDQRMPNPQRDLRHNRDIVFQQQIVVIRDRTMQAVFNRQHCRFRFVPLCQAFKHLGRDRARQKFLLTQSLLYGKVTVRTWFPLYRNPQAHPFIHKVVSSVQEQITTDGNLTSLASNRC